jgi:hypothetical protein
LIKIGTPKNLNKSFYLLLGLKIKMVHYTCTKCQTKIADTSLDRKKLDQQIWEHFCSFHAEEQELDALTIFRAYLKTEE